jgi:hypothetical protein
LTTPIAKMMETVEWRETGVASDQSGRPWATHEGVLQIGDTSLRCYRLNTGQAIINAEDMRAFFGDLLPTG